MWPWTTHVWTDSFEVRSLMGMARKNPSYRPRLLVEDLLHKAHPKGLTPEEILRGLVQRGESQPVLAGWLLGSGKRSGNQATSFSEGFRLAEKTTGTGAPSIPITWKGETRAASDWARRLGISASAISRRRKRGLPTAEVLRPAPR